MQGELTAAHFERVCYTVALAPCLAMEVLNRNNKKGPATYFERLVGHLFSRWLDTTPQKTAVLPVLDRNVRMTMDFLFVRQDGQANVHLPVKMSTRERVVQAWAHQRLLNDAFGDGRYVGLMVLFAETKLDSRTRDVVEICVPDQWLTYQTLLAKITAIYYFDVPSRYAALTRDYPHTIKICPFRDLFRGLGNVGGR